MRPVILHATLKLELRLLQVGFAAQLAQDLHNANDVIGLLAVVGQVVMNVGAEIHGYEGTRRLVDDE